MWVWNQEGTKKLVNGKQHSVWFVTAGMNGLPQNILLNCRLEFPKSDLTIYLPSRISKIFWQVVSTPYHRGKTCIKFSIFGTKRIVCNWVVYIMEVGSVLSLVSLGLRNLSRIERCPFCRDVQNEKFNICSRKIIWMNTVSGQLFFFVPSSSQFPRQLYIQSKPTYKDAEWAIESVHINRFSVLTL